MIIYNKIIILLKYYVVKLKIFGNAEFTALIWVIEFIKLFFTIKKIGVYVYFFNKNQKFQLWLFNCYYLDLFICVVLTYF